MTKFDISPRRGTGDTGENYMEGPPVTKFDISPRRGTGDTGENYMNWGGGFLIGAIVGTLVLGPLLSDWARTPTKMRSGRYE